MENWQYECLDLEKLQTNSKAMDEACQFEQIKIPYRHDPTERSRLRVRHGRITMELNGKLRNISIGGFQNKMTTNFKIFSEYAKDGQTIELEEEGSNQRNDKEMISTTCEGIHSTSPNNSDGQKWTRQMDAALLIGYNSSGGDRFAFFIAPKIILNITI